MDDAANIHKSGVPCNMYPFVNSITKILLFDDLINKEMKTLQRFNDDESTIFL